METQYVVDGLNRVYKIKYNDKEVVATKIIPLKSLKGVNTFYGKKVTHLKSKTFSFWTVKGVLKLNAIGGQK